MSEPVRMPNPITEATANALWDDAMPHGGIYSRPVPGHRGSLEFDGVIFDVVLDRNIPVDRKKRLRARLLIIRRWWWR